VEEMCKDKIIIKKPRMVPSLVPLAFLCKIARHQGTSLAAVCLFLVKTSY